MTLHHEMMDSFRSFTLIIIFYHSSLLGQQQSDGYFFTVVITGWLHSTVGKMPKDKTHTPFPSFILEREFQCHNTLLVRDIVCKTMQKFVKEPQDVRLSITVSFQPRITAELVTHESEAIATIQVDKPGNFYPGGQEKRARDKELEVLKKVEQEKQRERKEQRKKTFEDEDRSRPAKDLGVKRPPSTTTGTKATLARPAPPTPFKAEVRALPTGEMYAVREWVNYGAGKTPKASALNSPVPLSPVEIEDKPKYLEVRKPSSEEMLAIREAGDSGDDATERDTSSMETMDIVSEIDIERTANSSAFVALPLDSQIIGKEPRFKQGSIKLEYDRRSPSKVLAHITVD